MWEPNDFTFGNFFTIFLDCVSFRPKIKTQLCPTVWMPGSLLGTKLEFFIHFIPRHSIERNTFVALFNNDIFSFMRASKATNTLTCIYIHIWNITYVYTFYIHQRFVTLLKNEATTKPVRRQLTISEMVGWLTAANSQFVTAVAAKAAAPQTKSADENTAGRDRHHSKSRVKSTLICFSF